MGQKEVMSFVSGIRALCASLSREQRWFAAWVGLAGIVLAFLAVPGPRAGKAALKVAEAHAAGNPAGTADYVAHWLPKAAQGGLSVAVLLLLGTRWLVRPVPAEHVPGPGQGVRSRWVLTAFTGLTMLYSGIANAPRLEFSLWGDEEATMRKTVVGQFGRGKDGKLVFDAPSWTETVFRYRDPNNHPLNSVVSRLSHAAFARDLTRPDGFYFDERALRLPVFAAGLLGLAMLAWVGWVLGKPAVGGLAVGLMAMHPWFVRYGVETRGYGFLLLFTPLALGCLIRATQTGRWRWWIGYGFSQFLILWSYPGALQLLTALNVSAVCLVFFMKGPSRAWRHAQAGRWLTACVLGAVLCTLLMLPLVQPLLFYLKSARMQGLMEVAWSEDDRAWYADAAAWLFTGMPWGPWDAGSPLCWSWQQAVVPHLRLAGSGVFAVALLMGGAGWWWRGGIARWMLPALLLPAPLFLLQFWIGGGFIYPWYLFPALVGVVLLISGMLFFPLRVSGPILLLWIGLLFISTAKAVRLLREHPIEQMRAGTKLTRPVSLPSDPRIDDVMTIDILMTTRGYDPAVLPLSSDDPGQFKIYLAEADANRKPLFVHFGSPDFADSVRPQVMALVRNTELFEPIATFPGMDGPYTRQVFRYRPGSLGR